MTKWLCPLFNTVSMFLSWGKHDCQTQFIAIHLVAFETSHLINLLVVHQEKSADQQSYEEKSSEGMSMCAFHGNSSNNYWDMSSELTNLQTNVAILEAMLLAHLPKLPTIFQI